TWPNIETAPGNNAIRLRRAAVMGADGEPGATLAIHDRLRLEVDYWNLVPNVRLNVSLTVYNQEGTCVFTTPSVTDPHWHGRPFSEGLYPSTCHIPDHLLNEGVYRVTVMLVRDLHHVVYYYDDAISFEVCDSPSGRG